MYLLNILKLQKLKSGTGSHIENINLFGLVDEVPVQVGTTTNELLNYYIFPNDTTVKPIYLLMQKQVRQIKVKMLQLSLLKT